MITGYTDQSLFDPGGNPISDVNDPNAHAYFASAADSNWVAYWNVYQADFPFLYSNRGGKYYFNTSLLNWNVLVRQIDLFDFLTPGQIDELFVNWQVNVRGMFLNLVAQYGGAGPSVTEAAVIAQTFSNQWWSTVTRVASYPNIAPVIAKINAWKNSTEGQAYLKADQAKNEADSRAEWNKAVSEAFSEPFIPGTSFSSLDLINTLKAYAPVATKFFEAGAVAALGVITAGIAAPVATGLGVSETVAETGLGIAGSAAITGKVDPTQALGLAGNFTDLPALPDLSLSGAANAVKDSFGVTNDPLNLGGNNNMGLFDSITQAADTSFGTILDGIKNQDIGAIGNTLGNVDLSSVTGLVTNLTPNQIASAVQSASSGPAASSQPAASQPLAAVSQAVTKAALPASFLVVGAIVLYLVMGKK